MALRFVSLLAGGSGIVVVRGKTNGNKISFFVGKDGYYGTRSERSFVPMGAERDVKAGKWQPYPFEDSVVLKLIRTLIPLVSRHGIYKQKWLHCHISYLNNRNNLFQTFAIFSCYFFFLKQDISLLYA